MAPSTDAKASPPTVPPALPPSVETAYRIKCIQMKRRLNEVEASNDAARLRIARQKRQNEKMRLERALLLEILSNRMHKIDTPGDGDESEGSSDGPPTPQEKPLRSKKPHRRHPISPSITAATQSSAIGGPVRYNLDPTSDIQQLTTNGTSTRTKAASTTAEPFPGLDLGTATSPSTTRLPPHPDSAAVALLDRLKADEIGIPMSERADQARRQGTDVREVETGESGLIGEARRTIAGQRRQTYWGRAKRGDADEDVVMASGDDGGSVDGE